MISIVLLITVFLLGFISVGWPYWKSTTELGETKETLAKTQKLLVKAEIGNHLLAALVDAERGAFEAALKKASTFFSRLRGEFDRGDSGAFSNEEKGQLQLVLDQRDAVLGKLAVKDADGIEGLHSIYGLYRRATGGDMDNEFPVETAPADNTNRDQLNSNQANTPEANVSENSPSNQNSSVPDVPARDFPSANSNKTKGAEDTNVRNANF